MGVSERRQRERAQRREQIIDAAERVFFAKGAVQATMDDVATEAELSKGTLYLYFKSKDELYVALSLRCLRMIVTHLDAVEQPGLRGLEQLRAYLAAQRCFVDEHPERFQILIAWLASGFHADTDMPSYEAYQAAALGLFERIVSQLTRGQRDGSIRPDIDPHLTTMQLWGSALGVSLLRVNRDEIARRLTFRVDFDVLVPSLMERLLTTLRAANDEGVPP